MNGIYLHALNNNQLFSTYAPNPAVSCNQYRFLNSILRQPAKNILSPILENQFNRLAQVIFCFLYRFTLSVGTWHFWTNSPISTLWCRFNNCCKFCFHCLSFLYWTDFNISYLSCAIVGFAANSTIAQSRRHKNRAFIPLPLTESWHLFLTLFAHAAL